MYISNPKSMYLSMTKVLQLFYKLQGIQVVWEVIVNHIRFIILYKMYAYI